MTYDFKNLSPADFEDLVRELIGRHLGIRFEAFAVGPDGGSDGRHSKGGKIILQSKHYAGSTLANLKSKMKIERAAIDQLNAQRYLLATSLPITSRNKKDLASLIGPTLLDESDIFGPRDINEFLRRYPNIEKAHLKLWLSSTAVLERVLQSAQHAFNELTREDIDAKVRVYAPNPSFNDAERTLEDHHVLIISGPPGVGKTTLAEMLCYTYLASDWELVGIRSLDDGFAAIDDKKKQIFLFDDFLGKVALDKQALSHKDSYLAQFIKRVRKSANARFVLTTRAYIFEEARRVSEHLADRRLDISKYVLDVGVYTRRIKARILYNHLLIAGTSHSLITALIESGIIPRIVDHKNYNPRIVEWMTDNSHIGDLKPEQYPAAFLDALDHPNRLWDIAFRTHIPKKCQNLLYALFFNSEYSVRIDDLRISFDGLHSSLSNKYGSEFAPDDFDEALRILEGSFVHIAEKTVRFVNPSLRDYLTDHLDNLGLLIDFANASVQPDVAEKIWKHGIAHLVLNAQSQKSFAIAFYNAAIRFQDYPLWRIEDRESGFPMRYPVSLSISDRIGLLIQWGEISKDERFFTLASEIAQNPLETLTPWRDGIESIELIRKLRDGDYFEASKAANIADSLERAAIVMLEGHVDNDDLEKISDSADDWKESLSADFHNALEAAIAHEIKNIEDTVEQMDSESTLEDQIKTIRKLSNRVNLASKEVEIAIEKVKSRIKEVGEEAIEDDGPPIPKITSSREDTFDNAAMRSLFMTLTKN